MSKQHNNFDRARKEIALMNLKSELSASITQLSGYMSAIEALETENQRLRELCEESGVATEPDCCEAGCPDLVVSYDIEGCPLCQSCADALEAEAVASDRRKSIK